jgi:hypothetical protein
MSGDYAIIGAYGMTLMKMSPIHYWMRELHMSFNAMTDWTFA